MQKGQKKRKVRPRQDIQSQEGQEEKMTPQPAYEMERKEKRLEGKIAVITGADSGIGRAIVVAFAKEGAKCVLCYNEDDKDAKKTIKLAGQYGGECLPIKGDISDSKVCDNIVKKTIRKYGRINVLINNAAVQFPKEKLSEISDEQILKTFSVNIFSQFYMLRAAEPYLKKGCSIINTASVVAYRGNKQLLDYTATKGAIISFTRAMSGYFSNKGIRVNAVAPGPIWTPLIPSTFPEEHVETFGTDTPLGRAGQPAEVAYAYVYLASDEASYVTGQTIHVNGGEVVNG